MENASCIFYAEESVTGDRKWEEVIAHEIAHQWFGDMASEKSFAHLWLSEGFATYLTDLYFEKNYGKENADKRLQKERSEVIDFLQKTHHPVVDSTHDLMSLLNANSYQKGGWVLHMLRQVTGDSSFQKIIQTYYNQFKGSNADTRDFEAVAEKVSGKDLRWFFDQWLYRSGLPEVDVTWKMEKGGVRLCVAQVSKEVFRFPLTIGYRAGGKWFYDVVNVAKKGERFFIKTDVGQVDEVVLDPHTELLFKGRVGRIR
jgi:aminopeptidase N